MKQITLYTLILVALDQLLKYMAVHYLNMYETIPIIPHFISLSLAYNKGVSFGFLANLPDLWRNIILIGASTLASIAIYIFLWKKQASLPLLERIGLVLILSGALGNLYDRAVHKYVVDYVAFHIFTTPLFINNLADDFISIGLVFIVYNQFFNKKS